MCIFVTFMIMLVSETSEFGLCLYIVFGYYFVHCGNPYNVHVWFVDISEDKKLDEFRRSTLMEVFSPTLLCLEIQTDILLITQELSILPSH